MNEVLEKYLKASVDNLQKKNPHRQVWSVWMSDILDADDSVKDHIYFGSVQEY